ncbi:MAG TPA: cytochrome c-type biogenesis protein CcmH [Candidatus Eisenbacteria bacterium]
MKRAGTATTLLTLLFILAGWIAPAPAAAVESAAGRKDPARAITSQLICPCSCGEILSGCTCDTGKAMQGFVSDALKSGKGKDAIVASLVAKYGEVIRGAPKAQGFNLIVWIAPFVATAIGFLIAAFVLRRWVGRRRVAAPGPGGAVGGLIGAPTTVGQDLARLRARAEAELKRMGE